MILDIEIIILADVIRLLLNSVGLSIDRDDGAKLTRS